MATTRKPTTSTTKTTTKAKSTAASSTVKPAEKMPVTVAAKSAAATKSAPTVVDSPQPVVAGPVMRKRELIDAVVAKSGIKKKDAKPVVEAMLHVLGSALQDGRELNLQPMGKVKVNREKKLAEGKVLIARIRQARDMPTSPVAAEQEAQDAIDAPAAAE